MNERFDDFGIPLEDERPRIPIPRYIKFSRRSNKPNVELDNNGIDYSKIEPKICTERYDDFGAPMGDEHD